ncbi:MAG: hypothetical protein WDO73_15280 [Ignavibacteriota bacterium]
MALADANGKFTSREVIATPTDPKTAVDDLIDSIRRILASSKGKKVEGVGISLPGRFSHISIGWCSRRISNGAISICAHHS